jgi:hypothetical protein
MRRDYLGDSEQVEPLTSAYRAFELLVMRFEQRPYNGIASRKWHVRQAPAAPADIEFAGHATPRGSPREHPSSLHGISGAPRDQHQGVSLLWLREDRSVGPVVRGDGSGGGPIGMGAQRPDDDLPTQEHLRLPGWVVRHLEAQATSLVNYPPGFDERIQY